MQLITERVLIQCVADRWFAQYQKSNKDIYKELLKLNKCTSTAEHVKKNHR